MNISYSLLDPGLYICTFLYLCGCEVLSKCTVFSLTITRTVLVDVHTHNRSDNAWLLKWGGGNMKTTPGLEKDIKFIIKLC